MQRAVWRAVKTHTGTLCASVYRHLQINYSRLSHVYPRLSVCATMIFFSPNEEAKPAAINTLRSSLPVGGGTKGFPLYRTVGKK